MYYGGKSPVLLDTTAYEAINNNSILFLKKAITQLIKDTDIDKPMKREDAILSSIYIQLSLELTIKATVIKKTGFKNILNISKHNNDTEADLLDKFNNNEIKVKEFETLKNFVKGNISIFSLDKVEIDYIEKFQKYRNKLVHLNYNFTTKELENMKKDLIYIILHVIIKIVAEEKDILPSEFYISNLEHGEFQKLTNYGLYRTEMKILAKQLSSIVYSCPICGNESFLFEEKYCYTCLSRFDDEHSFGFIDCYYCKASNSVLYDRLNIHSNQHIARGLCLNCKEDHMVYECPECEKSYSIDTTLLVNQKCRNGVCKNLRE
jgi:hypothetical protein